MTVFYVVLNEMMTGIVPSQVVAPARAYAEALPEISARIVFLEPARIALGRAARERLARLRALWPEGRMALCPYVGRLGASAPATSLSAYLRLSAARRGRVVLHCRGPEATLHAARAARAAGGRVVFDARGATSYETVLRISHQGRGGDPGALEEAFERGRQLDRSAAARADAVVAVSEPLLREVAGERAGDGPASGVIPCCVESRIFCDAARRRTRAALGVGDDELLCVHTSTEARWEAFDQVTAFFRALRSRRPARLLFLTTLGAEVVTAGLGAEDPLRRSVVVRRAAPQEVRDYLSASDVGLLLRRPHAAHRLASPVKFAEYLGAGLATAVSEGIGTTAGVVREFEAGVVVPDDPGDEALEAAAARLLGLLDGGADALRRRAILACERHFVWQRYTPVISRVYGLS